MYDAKAEAKLRRKIDLMVVPTVSILYLFCFIDRANIGMIAAASFNRTHFANFKDTDMENFRKCPTRRS